MVALVPAWTLAPAIAGAALLALSALGGLAAKAESAKVVLGILRVAFWSALAMAVTYGIGAAFGTATPAPG